MSDNDDSWFTDDVFVPEPFNPGGAAAGPGAIGPVPASLVSNTTSSDDDWFTAPGWHDNNTAVDPGGAAAGPGAIGPVPAQLISNTSGPGDYHWEIGDDGLTRYIQELDPVEGAGPGPSVGGGLAPVSNTTGPGAPGGAGAPFQVNYAELEKFAKEHDLNAEEIAQWASGDPDFPERYLATHGKVNYGTYLKIREFMASKQMAGATFAEHNVQTSTALRASIASTKATDESSAAGFNAPKIV